MSPLSRDGFNKNLFSISFTWNRILYPLQSLQRRTGIGKRTGAIQVVSVHRYDEYRNPCCLFLVCAEIRVCPVNVEGRLNRTFSNYHNSSLNVGSMLFQKSLTKTNSCICLRSLKCNKSVPANRVLWITFVK